MQKSLLVSGLLLLSTFHVQIHGQDYGSSYYEEFDVVLYQLQVNVRDRDGNHISGLTKEDFEVRIDGNTQKIELVEEIKVDAWLDRPDADEFPEQAKRLFVFFFDLRYTSKKGLLLARDAARQFVLSDALPSDLCAVFTYHHLRGISMLTPFTNDAEQLMLAIDTLGLDKGNSTIEGRSGYFARSQLDDLSDQRIRASTRQTVGRIDESAIVDHFIEITQLQERTERAIYDREVLGYMNSFEKFASAMSLMRGRKNLIWFSSGFDAAGLIGNTAQEIRDNNELVFTGQHYRVSPDQYGNSIVQNESAEAIEQLQKSGTVIFSVDTALMEESLTNKAGIHTLNLFAKDTGGKVYTNTNNINESLSEIQNLTNDYYLVSCYPVANRRPGQVSRLRTKVNVPGARVYATKGILTTPNFSKLTDIEKQIHLSEYISRDQVVTAIPLDVNFLQVPFDEKLVKLATTVDIRGDYFTLSRRTCDLEVHTLAFSKETSQLFDQSYFRFKVDPEKTGDILQDTGVKYFASLFVKPGKYKLKVVARDMTTGKVGSWIKDIQIHGEASPLSGPTLLTDSPWVMVRAPEGLEARIKLGNLDFSYPYTIGDTNFVPQNQNLVASAGSQGFFYLLNDIESGSEDMPVVQAMVMDEKGHIQPIPSSAMQANAEYRDHNRLAFLLDVDMDKLVLNSGQNYKLMTQFKLGNRAPIRSVSEFVVQD